MKTNNQTTTRRPVVTRGKIAAVRNGQYSQVTVAEITEIRRKRLAELGMKSDGSLPADLATPPGFTRKIYEWVLETATCKQPLFALSASLILLGTIFGQKVKSALGLYTNLFAMNVGRSSSGKDHPLHVVRNALNDAGASHLWRSKVTSDAAIEAALADNSNLLVSIDEAGHFFRSANARGNRCNPSNSIKPALLELWSSAGKLWKGKQRAKCYGNPQEIVAINNPHVCFYGATQPEIFFDGISVEDVRDGWLPRILAFFSLYQPMPQIKSQRETPEDIVRIIKSWTCEGAEKTTHVLQPTEDALTKLNEYSNDIFHITSGESTSAILYGKVIENSIRIATILAMSRHINDPRNAVIDSDDITYAYNLVRYLTMTLEDVLKINVAENHTERLNKRMLKIIKEAGDDGITTSMLTGKSRWITSQGRHQILEDLIESGDIDAKPTRKGGMLFTARRTSLDKTPSNHS